jgi:hypothetical protein
MFDRKGSKNDEEYNLASMQDLRIEKIGSISLMDHSHFRPANISQCR